jgi:long-subunit fatty acid transport protein
VKYTVAKVLSLGASAMLPYHLRGPASLSATLPSAAAFDTAVVQGDRADFDMPFPLIVPIGSEFRPWPSLRLEGAFGWEQWSTQKSIDATRNHVRMVNVRGLGDYDVGPIELMRNMGDTWSVRGGCELFVPQRFLPALLKKTRYAMRGGIAYEKSAFTDKPLTPLALDSDKVLLTGASASI